LAKIAAGAAGALAADRAGGITARVLARGEGWEVEDVRCTSGPRDRPFEERHDRASIAVVVAGTFQYRSSAGAALMTPGSLLLGDPGQTFECAHDHAAGDRCVSFHYAPEVFAGLAAEASGRPRFGVPRLPPLRALSPLVARAWAGLRGPLDVSWEELAVQLAGRAMQLAAGTSLDAAGPTAAALARVTRALQAIEHEPDATLSLSFLAREARLSPYHFLRTFQQVTGLTPHQYVRRARLREAAARLATGRAKVLEVALDSGFGDVSNFNRAFRIEFGVSPRAYRADASAW
jgi:AraC-like DNA-binding protein